ncbi:MAG TPA: carbonic anhydrase [Acidimicrobiales bacterium]
MHALVTAPSTSRFLAAAAQHQAGFKPGARSAAPARHVAVVACMDARLDLFRLLGLEVGDAHILRNAGGRVTDDVIRSLVLSSHALGTREVLVIHHTGCGLLGTTNDELRARVHAATGQRADHIDFLPFDDAHASVRHDVELVRACELLPADLVAWGCVYDVADGSLTQVA